MCIFMPILTGTRLLIHAGFDESVLVNVARDGPVEKPIVVGGNMAQLIPLHVCLSRCILALWCELQYLCGEA